ncbi:hypothetical protein J2S59_000881 [Nocardioides massiliensis]|uniref:Uncharacterized protein n=1 Tax=Nocardioides massiliensis TaxID=1325935 RepID=A0ABT9NLG7_9ACTN|nr:hypothetical protein [Nocardioides massiliensis]
MTGTTLGTSQSGPEGTQWTAVSHIALDVDTNRRGSATTRSYRSTSRPLRITPGPHAPLSREEAAPLWCGLLGAMPT